MAVARVPTELGQAFTQDGLRQELRNEQAGLVGLTRCGLGPLDRCVVGAALAVDPSEPRVGAAGGGEPVEDAQILEHLLTARLDALAP
jgi:hypothetical protein